MAPKNDKVQCPVPDCDHKCRKDQMKQHWTSYVVCDDTGNPLDPAKWLWGLTGWCLLAVSLVQEEEGTHKQVEDQPG